MTTIVEFIASILVVYWYPIVLGLIGIGFLLLVVVAIYIVRMRQKSRQMVMLINYLHIEKDELKRKLKATEDDRDEFVRDLKEARSQAEQTTRDIEDLRYSEEMLGVMFFQMAQLNPDVPIESQQFVKLRDGRRIKLELVNDASGAERYCARRV